MTRRFLQIDHEFGTNDKLGEAGAVATLLLLQLDRLHGLDPSEGVISAVRCSARALRKSMSSFVLGKDGWTQTDIEAALVALAEQGLIERREDGSIYLPKWEEWFYAGPLSGAERTRRWRENQKAEDGDPNPSVHGSVTECDGQRHGASHGVTARDDAVTACDATVTRDAKNPTQPNPRETTQQHQHADAEGRLSPLGRGPEGTLDRYERLNQPRRDTEQWAAINRALAEVGYRSKAGALGRGREADRLTSEGLTEEGFWDLWAHCKRTSRGDPVNLLAHVLSQESKWRAQLAELESATRRRQNRSGKRKRPEGGSEAKPVSDVLSEMGPLYGEPPPKEEGRTG